MAQLRTFGKSDLDRCAVDGSHIRALKGGPRRPLASRPRSPRASEHHLICDPGGIPLAISITGGNRHNVTHLIPLIDAVPPIRSRRGRPRRRPRELFADRGYYHDVHRRQLRQRGITPRTARRGVERAFAWLHAFGRLRTRYERRADIHLGLLPLACSSSAIDSYPSFCDGFLVV